MEFEQDLLNALFVKFRNGDQKAFKSLFDLYKNILFRYIVSWTKDKEESEEILQECFVQLHLNKDRIESASKIYPYLFTIAKRLTISHYRKMLSRQKLNQQLSLELSEVSDRLDEHLDAKELSGYLNQIIDQLSEKQKMVYLLNKIERLSYLEIADQMQISVHTVRNQLASANRHIKLKLSGLFQ